MKVYLLGIFLFVLSSFGYGFTEKLADQESYLEDQLTQASSSEQIAKISLALATVKKQQSSIVFEKLPEYVGRDRSMVNSSVKESISYRQMASLFKNDPGRTYVASTYVVTNAMNFFCVIIGCFFLLNRLRYRY